MKPEYLKTIDIVKPREEAVSAFTERVRSSLQRVAANKDKAVTLAAIRDALLPKLLSGEIRVGEAEKITVDVA